MNKIIKTTLLPVILLITLVACGPSYNTNFAPPDESSKLSDTFPKKIDGFEGKLQAMNLSGAQKGFEVIYGDYIMKIQIIRNKTKSHADDYFKNNIVPEFDAMPSHARAQVNGKWTARGKGKDGTRMYGWVNQNWIFVIKAKDDKHFDMLIDNFKFISKK